MTMMNLKYGFAALVGALVLTGCPSAAPRPGSLAVPAANPAAAPAGNPAVSTGTSAVVPAGTAGKVIPAGTTKPAPAPISDPTTVPPAATGSGIIAGHNSGAAGGTGRSTVACPSTALAQMERLGRPAINEGLVAKNNLLNIYNSVDPTVDLTDAAIPVRGNVVTTLDAFLNTVPDGVATPAANAGAKLSLLGAGDMDYVVNNFLPDVMRIDTTIESGYVGTANLSGSALDPDGIDGTLPNVTLAGRLVGGRWITDDVIDMTLLYLIPNSTNNALGGTLHSDGVRYITNHRLPYASFPYLVNPY